MQLTDTNGTAIEQSEHMIIHEYYFSSTNTTFPLRILLFLYGFFFSKFLKISQNFSKFLKVNHCNTKVVLLGQVKISQNFSKFLKISQNFSKSSQNFSKSSQNFSKFLKVFSKSRQKQGMEYKIPGKNMENHWTLVLICDWCAAISEVASVIPSLLSSFVFAMPASKRQRIHQQMMNPLMMMLPQMAAQMAAMNQPLDEESGDEAGTDVNGTNVNGTNVNEEKPERRAQPEQGQMSGAGVQDKISSSVTFLRQVPRCRLAEGLEWLCKDLDPSMTHALTNVGLLALVFLCTRLNPITRINDLRAMVCIIVSNFFIFTSIYMFEMKHVFSMLV